LTLAGFIHHRFSRDEAGRNPRQPTGAVGVSIFNNPIRGALGPRHQRAAPGQTRHQARVVVVGNEKGGAGKSTVAALIATSMLYQGKRVW
jgi:Mrp family chromosome partitioning ATPase